jgi:hypothetical protein
MLSHLLLPEVKAKTDLEAIYYRNRKWFFGLTASVAFVSLLEDFISFGQPSFDLNFWFRLFFIAFCGIGVWNGSKRLQLPLALVLLVLFIIYIALLFLRLG